MGDTVHVGPGYTAPKISAVSYLSRTFSLLIMGDTERPRYTGFRGLSVRGITALQCTLKFFVEKMREAFAMQKLHTFFQQKILAYLRYEGLKL